MQYFRILLLLPALMVVLLPVKGQDAREIVRKADANARGKTTYSESLIRIVRPKWKREMEMKGWSKGEDYFLILITAPARDKGTVTLKRKNEVWSWMPAVERSIKLPPSMMMQSWMGTDFTNDDLVKQSSIVEDYSHEISGDSTIENRSCYKVRLIPKPEAAVVWGRILLWIDKQDYMQLRAEFYDEEGELVNTMKGSDIRQFGSRKLPSKMEMIPADKSGHKTVLEYKTLEFDKPIEDSFFSVQNMTKVK